MRSMAVLLLAVLAGCAQPRPAGPPPVINTATPTCGTKLECDGMWIDAQRSIETATGMRTRLVTDGRIVTYAPTNYGRMGGEVVKYPLGGDRYEMRASFECYRSTDCSDLRILATNLFNNLLRGYRPK